MINKHWVLGAGLWFSLGIPDYQHITEILLKVALNTITPPILFDEKKSDYVQEIMLKQNTNFIT
jgi:hypothetical protein